MRKGLWFLLIGWWAVWLGLFSYMAASIIHWFVCGDLIPWEPFGKDAVCYALTGNVGERL